jgi:NMD protein affecting ribosome stability and mRNA decay
MTDQTKRCRRCGRDLPAWELPDVCVRCFVDTAEQERNAPARPLT